MKDLDIFNFYALLVLSLFALILSVILSRAVKRNKSSGKTGSFNFAVKASFTLTAFIGLSSLLSAFTKISIIQNISVIISLIISAVFFIRAFKTHKTETDEAHKKELETAVFIENLKNQPAKEARQMQGLISTGTRLLQSVTYSLHTKKDPFINLYENSVKSLIKELNADGAVFLIADSFEDILIVKCLEGKFPPPYPLPEDVPHKEDRVFSNFKHSEFKLEDSVFGKIALSGKVKLIEDGSKNELLPKNGEESFLKHGSLIFFPLIADDKLLGITAVSRLSDKEPFTLHDVKIGSSITEYTAGILSLTLTLTDTIEASEIDNISDTASKIQKIMLPKNLKKIQGLDIASHFLQAKGICSDYYDVINLQNRILIIAVDVAGKSVQAAIVMIMIRTILYLITGANQSIEYILDCLNKGITGKIDIDHFASISLLSYQPKKSIIEFIGAGNQALMIYRKSTKKIELFQQNTDPLGVDVKSKYKSKAIKLEKGDVISLYTDGIIECLNHEGEQYGIKRLAHIIAENSDKKSKDIADKINKDSAEFMGKILSHDDHTVIIIKEK